MVGQVRAQNHFAVTGPVNLHARVEGPGGGGGGVAEEHRAAREPEDFRRPGMRGGVEPEGFRRRAGLNERLRDAERRPRVLAAGFQQKGNF